MGYKDDLDWYAYVGNDPTNKADPSGLYTCSGSKDNCTQVNRYVDKLNESLKNLNPKSKDYAKVEAASKYLGTAGDKNGVIIHPTTIAGTATALAQKGNKIDIDVGKISKFATKSDPDQATVMGAGTLGHEARHELDNRDIFKGNGPQSKAQEHRTEMNAFNTQGAIYRGLGRTSQLDNPEGVLSAAQKSIDIWCSNGGSC